MSIKYNVSFICFTFCLVSGLLRSGIGLILNNRLGPKGIFP